MNEPDSAAGEVVQAVHAGAGSHNEALLSSHEPDQAMLLWIEPLADRSTRGSSPWQRIRDMETREIAFTARKGRDGFITTAKFKDQIQYGAAALGELPQRKIVTTVDSKPR